MNEKPFSPKILCVDDEPSILHSLERLLRDRFQVLTAESGKHGLTTLREHPDCAIVLSDYRMPDMTGVEFLRQVRVLYPQTSRAILSGQIDLQSVSDALNAADIHKFFLKPWENEYLVLQMLEAVQLHHTLTEKAHFEHLSITDPITQLTNHRFFQDRLRLNVEQARGTKEGVGLVMFDVDNFKMFNDRFGHPEGDRLLFAVASTLKKLAGEAGTVSRYGGEEFAMILPGMNEADALALTERVRAHFERTSFTGLSARQSYVTISAGLAVFPVHAGDAKALIEAADRALYAAKRQGRNQVVVASNR
jgi:two-component system, cell cycle response regulator